MFFERLVWQPDRMLLADLVFRLQQSKSEDWDLGDECFRFVKNKFLVDQYAHWYATLNGFRPRNILELGLFDGGSLAFWFELFQPDKLIGVDITQRQDSPYFQQYVAARGLENRIKTYWGVDQTDAAMLREIVGAEFSGPLDLVIDDASHRYEETKSSFETLFPLLRHRGLYVIEDWAWSHWDKYQDPASDWARRRALTDLIVELVEASGTSIRLVPSVRTCQGFAVAERGGISRQEIGEFKLEHFISRRTQIG